MQSLCAKLGGKSTTELLGGTNVNITFIYNFLSCRGDQGFCGMLSCIFNCALMFVMFSMNTSNTPVGVFSHKQVLNITEFVLVFGFALNDLLAVISVCITFTVLMAMMPFISAVWF
jgi:hypothetical protein